MPEAGLDAFQDPENSRIQEHIPKVHGLWKEFLSFLRLGWIRGHLLGFQNHMSRGILELSYVSTVWHEAREVGGWPANSPIESKQALSSDGEMLEAKGRKRFPKWMSSRNGWFRILYNNYHSLAFHFAFWSFRILLCMYAICAITLFEFASVSDYLICGVLIIVMWPVFVLLGLRIVMSSYVLLFTNM